MAASIGRSDGVLVSPLETFGELRASLYEPGNWVGLVRRMNFAFCPYVKFQPG